MWLDQLWPHACLAVSLPLPHLVLYRSMPPVPQETGAGYPRWVWCVRDESVRKYSCTMSRRLQLTSMVQQVKYSYRNIPALPVSLPEEAGALNRLFLTSGKLERMVPTHYRGVTRINRCFPSRGSYFPCCVSH